ncbi:ankyrin repeat domain-containing protein [Tepidimonas aquatica]|uniref:Trp: transient-receptor-potential calcium channel protein n=1 Tax=Tepidimonas aquatica TaxID=247482 RepID=A0A554WCM8_9BURK|nr:ankyrin repeat domain-containing protein [Tepidimonas aquatica]TSE21328.1 trp: transient-receptor-potential calcium channel protein [Tepidimonas aquatica]
MAYAQRAYDRYITAIIRDDVSTVIDLQLRGLDVNTPDPDLNPPLVLALQRDALAVARHLVTQHDLNLEATNPAGENALMIAALRGHLDIVQQLLARGAQVNRPGWAPLHYAASGKTDQALPITRLLLEHHAYIDAESPNGSTPLMMAALYGTSDVVDLLLAEGADVTLRNQQGLTALDFAQRSGRDHVVQRIAAALRATIRPRGEW